MKWKIINNGSVVIDENDNVVCFFPENTDSLFKALVKYAPEMFDEIMDYSQSFDASKSPRNPKKHYDRFQRILEYIQEAKDL